MSQTNGSAAASAVVEPLADHRAETVAHAPAPLASRIRDKLRDAVLLLRRLYFVHVWKMDIGEGTAISMSAKLDKTNPRGVHIGKYTVVTFGAAVLSHDYVNNANRDVYIGDNCFIGAHAIILPGVRIGDHCIVAASSLVVRDVPSGSLVTGNPARVVETNVKTTYWGVRIPRGQDDQPRTGVSRT
jgi:acetyltransferase-like isoleucine patch superfamily enzyme